MKNKAAKFFKNLGFGFVIGFLIATVGTTLTIYLILFSGALIKDLAFATGIMAIGTLILAGFTFWNIRSSNRNTKLDRQDRLLDSMLEWATNVLAASTPVSQKILVFSGSSERFVEDEEGTWKALANIEILRPLQAQREKGKYIRKIAGIAGVTAEQKADDLWNVLTKLVELLDDVRVFLEVGADPPSPIDISDETAKIPPLCNSIIEETAATKLRIANQ